MFWTWFQMWYSVMKSSFWSSPKRSGYLGPKWFGWLLNNLDRHKIFFGFIEWQGIFSFSSGSYHFFEGTPIVIGLKDKNNRIILIHELWDSFRLWNWRYDLFEKKENLLLFFIILVDLIFVSFTSSLAIWTDYACFYSLDFIL